MNKKYQQPSGSPAPRPVKVIATNRKAHHDYAIGDKYEAGIQLTGTEVKAIRSGKVNLNDSWVDIDHQLEAFVRDLHIGHYSHGNRMNHEEKRPRKLLLKHAELVRLTHQIEAKGSTVVPIKILFRGQLVKIEIAVARGKQEHDKRDSTKEKEAQREISRAFKTSRR